GETFSQHNLTGWDPSGFIIVGYDNGGIGKDTYAFSINPYFEEYLFIRYNSKIEL
ncbi:MAG: hypothetical protein CI952_1468, partial [Methanohalophilus sp.]